MTEIADIELARQFCVDDLPGAGRAGARLNGILRKLDAGEPISPFSRLFLADSGLHALGALADGRSPWSDHRDRAERERTLRIEKATAKAVTDAVEHVKRRADIAAAANANVAAIMNDPVHRRRREGRELRQRFGLGYIDEEHYGRVMGCLRRVANRQRLPKEEVIWLQTKTVYCWTGELAKAWHMLEAEACTRAWQQNRNAWDAVNGSKHWRRAEEPHRALALTEAALSQSGLPARLSSALATTRGGAMRDLDRLDEAEELATEAHRLTPGDYRPCTLLGSIHIARGNHRLGLEWYEKAERLGAPCNTIEGELRSLLARLPVRERERLSALLNELDLDFFGPPVR
jgi:tetratricopeptide (TPR) repeat protein